MRAANHDPPEATKMHNITLDQARAAKAVARERLVGQYGLDSIVGVGITRLENSYAVKVNLSKQPPHDVRFRLPDNIDGVPVKFAVVGQVFARQLA
jgi:hypothetical protein